MKYLEFLAILLFMLGSCNPIEIPTPVNSEPVFGAKMEIDGHLVKFESGKLGQINHPTIGLKDKNQLTYYSVFNEEGCKRPCPSSLIFGFNSNVLYNARTYNFEKSFTIMDWKYNWLFENNEVTLRIETSKNSIRGLKLEEQWLQGSKLIDPRWQQVSNVSLSKTINADQSKLVCRKVRIVGGNALFLSCKDLTQLESTNGKDALELSINIERKGRSEYLLTAITKGQKGQLEIDWNDGSTNKSIKISQIKGRHTVKVYDPILKSKATASLFFDTEVFNDDYSKVVSSFSITKSARPINKDKVQPGSVSIRYVDANGHIFRSNNYKYPNDKVGRFEITNIEDYKEEDNMDNYKKVTLSFGCILFDSKGEQHKVKNGEAVIALKLPK